MLTCGVNDMFVVFTGHYNFTSKVLKNLPILFLLRKYLFMSGVLRSVP